MNGQISTGGRIRITISQYDNGIKIIMPITKDGMIEPLNGATVKFKMMNNNVGRTVEKIATITDATAGECEIVFTKEDTSMTGAYITEVETTFSNGTVLSCDNPMVIAITPERI